MENLVKRCISMEGEGKAFKGVYDLKPVSPQT